MIVMLCILVPIGFYIWAAVQGREARSSLFTDLRRRTLYPALIVALLAAVLGALIPDGSAERLGAAGGAFLFVALPGVTGLILFGLPGTLWLARWRPPLAVALLVVLGVAFAGGWLMLTLTMGPGSSRGIIDLSAVPLIGGLVAVLVAMAWIAFNHRLLRDTLSGPRVRPERPVYLRSNEADG